MALLKVREGLKRSGSGGFSLAEVLIALLILSILSVIITGAIPSAMFAMKKAETRAKAAAIGRQTLDYLRRVDFDKIDTGMDVTSVVQFQKQADSDERMLNKTDYSINVVVAQAVSGSVAIPLDRAKDVKVVVTWKDKEQKENSHIARTIFYNE
ncbi:MAG: prepilin-type N-terminal cleavage/methylation domain-containing protein [Vulcanimicrobiota bacterium]